ncbi:3-isopropylmalate dehydrogenase [Aggregatimonas sangjinii]|uniref:3-isopropylmalate dehydrogenase n=1 Tax=Aggregatimonas sangjinii TaxID=2583587 RepID=A0A5B7SPU4_9FLAO|nr:isocitrate/isopropylmalate family dehydrogenase [Aggregatimonas sangjinii]QCX00212.1 3-isopropylmalate dehydrogenase [Aggregatimonas sangjinii]
MKLRIAILGGDGVGPEVMAQAVKCLKAIGETFNHDFRFTNALIGNTAIRETGNSLPLKTLEVCANSDAILLGALEKTAEDSRDDNDAQPQESLGRLRKELGLFANIRPVKLFPGITANSPFSKNLADKVDFHIYREQLGGLYNGEGHLKESGSATDSCTYTEKEISRIAHLAFKAAKRRRKKVTLVDKANILDTSKLWRTVVTEIAGSYPEVNLECLEIDNAVVKLTLDPSNFDIILADAMFGDVISGQGSILLGAQGLLPSASLGEYHCMFKPTHGAFSKEKGKNSINPIASIFCVIMLLEKFGLKEEANAVFASVRKAFKKKVVVPDVLGSRKYGTDYVGDFIADNITDSDSNLNINDENIGLGKSTII